MVLECRDPAVSVDVQAFSESIEEDSLESSETETLDLQIGTKESPVPLRFKLDPIYEMLDVKCWSTDDQNQVPNLVEKQGFVEKAYGRYGELHGVNLTGYVKCIVYVYVHVLLERGSEERKGGGHGDGKRKGKEGKVRGREGKREEGRRRKMRGREGERKGRREGGKERGREGEREGRRGGGKERRREGEKGEGEKEEGEREGRREGGRREGGKRRREGGMEGRREGDGG